MYSLQHVFKLQIHCTDRLLKQMTAIYIYIRMIKLKFKTLMSFMICIILFKIFASAFGNNFLKKFIVLSCLSSFITPCEVTKLTKFIPNSARKDCEYTLRCYERNVQVSLIF